MKCPHCLENFHPDPSGYAIGGYNGKNAVAKDREGRWRAETVYCPACFNFTIFLVTDDDNGKLIRYIQVWPKGVARSPLSVEVPTQYAADYREACTVYPTAPRPAQH